MNGKLAKEIIIKAYESNFNDYGFILKKTKDANAIFLRTSNTGIDRFGLSFYLYYPSIRFGYAVSKRINIVELILNELGKKIKLSNNNYINEEVRKETSLSLYLLKEPIELKLIYAETEEEVIEGFSKIFDYMINNLLPILESFNDLRNIDKTINGIGEEFWEDDDRNDRPFNLAHLFYVRRLIIARLCKGENDFNSFVENIYSLIDKRCKDSGVPLLNRNDLNNRTNFVIYYLRKNVLPIY